MSALKVRKLPFEFDESIPFQWQPSNPTFATFLNQLSFFAVAFERYVIKALRDAMPLITSDEVRAEAKLFLEQEAQHSLAHKLHIDCLIKKYPGLKEAFSKSCQHYDNLYKKESTQFHLSYIANLEATFAPMLTFVINHREDLFSKGNIKVSSLFLWHAIEEIEHRSSAYVIYNDVVQNGWYRVSRVPHLAKHLHGFFALISSEFEKHVPLEDRTAGLSRPPEPLSMISRKERFVLTLNLIKCFFPWHDPKNEVEPAWYKDWMIADGNGEDMTRVYGMADS
jgi:predicted metal-dependent hydrolase